MSYYTVLTTYPGHRSSANVGDQLIEIALKRLLRHELGETNFLTIFREDSLEPWLEQINQTRAILLPAFPIRDAVPMYPGCYRLVEDISKLRPTLVPIGSNWNVYPGDADSREKVVYSKQTTDFLQYIARQVDHFSCREYHLMQVLEKHGITNTLMTGDPAWYDPDFFGCSFHRPSTIETVVFSPPLSAFYGAQAIEIMEILAAMFPSARKLCAFHLTDSHTSNFTDKEPTNDASMRSDVAEKNAGIRSHAVKLGFQVWELAGRVERLNEYRGFDLHVGYECHAHLAFFRQRRPSVLLAEDARGVGFNYTLGTGGFEAFMRNGDGPVHPPEEGGTSGYCVNEEEFAAAPARKDLAHAVRRFLEEECDSGFRRYQGIAAFIDETYEKAMGPFLRCLGSTVSRVTPL